MRQLQVSRRAPGSSAFRVLFWWTFIRFLVFLTFRVLYRMRMEGHEHVPATGPLIFASNHQSNFDPALVGSLTHDRPFAGVARASLFRFPLGPIIRSIGAVPINRDRGDAGAIRAALGELEAGRGVMIFPEGTRTRDGAIGTFKPGVMLLVKRAAAVGVRIVPVAIEGAYDAWPIGTSRPHLSGRIMVKAGPALDCAALLAEGTEAGLEHLKRQIETMRLELRGKIRAATHDRLPKPGPADQPYWQSPVPAQAPAQPRA